MKKQHKNINREYLTIMKKYTIFFMFLLLSSAGVQAQYTGGIGRGDFKLDYAYPVIVSNAHASSNGGYASLKLAFDAINAQVQTGFNITVTIVDNTTETASAVLNPGLWTTLSIYPTVTGLSITGINLAAPLIDLNGANNVTIDGRMNATGSAKDLIISNTSNSSASGTSTIRFINDACTNTVKYCTLKGSEIVANSTSTGSGIVFFSTGTTTGNDGNLIDNNNITNSSDGFRPLNAVFSLGTSAKENSGNTISNNNIYNFFSKSTSSYGINIGNNNTTWSITGNSFYETASFAPTAEADYSVINISTLGSGFTVNNNYIGGNLSSCGGAAWTKTSSLGNTFYAINLNIGTAVASSVQGNTIRNFSYANYTGKSWYAIYVAEGSVNIGTVTANTIGSATGNGSVSFTNDGSNVFFYGIFISGTGSTNTQNNIIGAITLLTTNTAYSNGFYGIKTSSTGATTISNNTIGSTDAGTSNSIYSSSISFAGTQSVCGIHNSGSGTISISGNTISKLTNATTNANNQPGLINGITSTSGSNAISNNTIRDLSIANSNTATDYTASVTGIALNNTAAAAQSITGNTIYNLSNTYASFAGNVIGLYYNGSTTASTVSGNFINSLSMSSPSTSANMYGIKIQNGKTTWSNNIISVGSNLLTNVYGIYERGDAGNDNSLYFNTVYISGDVGSVTPKSYALYSASSTNTRNFRNNIFDNQRFIGAKSPSATYSNYAACFNYAVSTNLTLDNNDYYISGMGSGALGYFNSADVFSLPLISGKDASSKSANPGLASAGGTAAVNYLPSNNTLIAATGTGITTDYGGTTRSVTYPAMGAWEYNLGPAVSVTATSGTLTGGYATLKAAFDAINLGTHQGAITVNINSSTTEAASAVLNASSSPSNYTSVNIYPTLIGLSISGNLATPLIDLNGADYVTIDGRVNATGSAKDLVITNTSTSSTAGTSTIRFINDACSNTVKYCTLKGSQTVVNVPGSGSGIVFFSNGTSTGNDNNLIDNNNITNAADANRPLNAIFSYGTSAKENSGITISNNNIYDFLHRSETFSTGICLRDYNDAWTITGNSFYETASFAATGATTTYAIVYLGSGGAHTVSSNHIGGSAPACSGTWTKTGTAQQDFLGIRID